MTFTNLPPYLEHPFMLTNLQGRFLRGCSSAVMARYEATKHSREGNTLCWEYKESSSGTQWVQMQAAKGAAA